LGKGGTLGGFYRLFGTVAVTIAVLLSVEVSAAVAAAVSAAVSAAVMVSDFDLAFVLAAAAAINFYPFWVRFRRVILLP
jgi:hypothetical protein